MNKALLADLNSLNHNITVDTSTLTASHFENQMCSTQFNFHANLHIDNKLFPVIIQGHLGDFPSMDEFNYGEIIGFGVNLRELIFKDQNFVKNTKSSELSRMFAITQDILQQDEYLNLIMNHQGKPFDAIHN